jgi:hypothetical protein
VAGVVLAIIVLYGSRDGSSMIWGGGGGGGGGGG